VKEGRDASAWQHRQRDNIISYANDYAHFRVPAQDPG
jgi:hypothetical protein